MSDPRGFDSSLVDFELHGRVGIRLVNARSSDVAAVTRQVGCIYASLSREPDIVIEFVEKIPVSSPLHYVGIDDTAFTDEAFFIQRGKHKTRTMVQIPFAQVGQQCHILCETGLIAVPLLIPIVNLTALRLELLPLHASAFEYQGKGVLTTGWTKGGKTEMLLAFMAQGAQYIGDEWIYITQDSPQMCGIQEPIRVWDWHLQSLPHYWSVVGQNDKIRLRILKTIVQMCERTASSGIAQKSTFGKHMKRITPFLNQQLYVDLPPRQLFGPAVDSRVTNVDRLIFVAIHASPDIIVRPIDPGDIARRMIFSLQEERRNFISYYHKFRFAFPEVENPFIEEVEQVERKLLTRLLAQKESYAVYHPYPVELPALFTAIEPLLH